MALKKSTKTFIDAMAIPGMDAHTAKIISKDGEEVNAATAKKQARRLQARIEERKKIAARMANVTPEMVIGATAMRAFATIDDAFDEDGNFDIRKARETGAIHLIKKLEKTQSGWKVEFYSNESAQDKLGNYLGLEKAPQENNDVDSLRAGVEAVARKIALKTGEKLSNVHLVLAWTKVAEWAVQSKSRYSLGAINELDNYYKSLGPGNVELMNVDELAEEAIEDEKEK